MIPIYEQVEIINEIFLKKYLSELQDFNPVIAGKLKKIFDFQKENITKTKEEFLELLRNQFGIDAVDNLGVFRAPDLIEAMDHYAKINDISRRLRVIANQQYVTQKLSTKTADAFEYVLNVFENREKMSPEQVQQVIDEGRFLPSLTAHPTNPNSVEYTRKAMELVDAITKNDQDLVEEKLKNVVREKITDLKKKTQQQEVEEGLLYLDEIYNGISLQYEHMQKAIDKSAYRDQVHLPRNMNQIAVWLAGDGDGNPTATEESLLMNVEMFKKRIKELYEAELKEMGYEDWKLDQYSDPQDFIDDLEMSRQLILNGKYSDEDKKYYDEKFDSLITKVHTFGFHYAKIDVRHEANDIMKVTMSLLKVVGVNTENLENKDLLALLDNEYVIKRIKDLDYKANNFGKDDALVKRLFGRFKVIAQNPEFFEKMIIAEFKEPKQISAVLLMLRASGNKVCEEGAHLSVVPLAESKPDLDKLDEDIAGALSQPKYLEHIKQTKKIYFMIAKSDTIRRDGVGAQISQEMAVRNSIKATIKTLLEAGEDLTGYEILPFNGGGHALQRGGGRITELASVYGRYALRALEELQEEGYDYENLKKIKISAPCLTTQGHQNGILYQNSEVAAGTLEAFASQSIYAAARRLGFSRDNVVDESKFPLELKIKDPNFKKELAKETDSLIREISDRAVGDFKKHIGEETSKTESPIVKLYKNASWLFTMTGNCSSRPGVRGADGGEPKTIEEAKGAKTSLLLQRAIGVEKICAHSATNLISWFGWRSGLQDMEDKNFDLNKLYAASKTFRDYMRSAAISLYMTNFETSWRMMIGKERPYEVRIKTLDALYQEKMDSGRQAEITNEETLSFLECEAERTKALIYKAITGKEAEGDYDIMEQFSILKAEVDVREKNCSFSEFLEAIISNIANKKPKEELDESLLRMVKTVYCGSDISCGAPISSLLTTTKTRSDLLYRLPSPYEADQIDPHFFDEDDYDRHFVNLAHGELGSCVSLLSSIANIPESRVSSPWYGRVLLESRESRRGSVIE